MLAGVSNSGFGSRIHHSPNCVLDLLGWEHILPRVAADETFQDVNIIALWDRERFFEFSHPMLHGGLDDVFDSLCSLSWRGLFTP